jgi:hypothetical protein
MLTCFHPLLSKLFSTEATTASNSLPLPLFLLYNLQTDLCSTSPQLCNLVVKSAVDASTTLSPSCNSLLAITISNIQLNCHYLLSSHSITVHLLISSPVKASPSSVCIVSTPQTFDTACWTYPTCCRWSYEMWVSFQNRILHTLMPFPCNWVRFSCSHHMSASIRCMCSLLDSTAPSFNIPQFQIWLMLCLFLVELPSVTYLTLEGWSWAAQVLQISVSGRCGYSHDGYCRFRIIIGSCCHTCPPKIADSDISSVAIPSIASVAILCLYRCLTITQTDSLNFTVLLHWNMQQPQ